MEKGKNLDSRNLLPVNAAQTADTELEEAELDQINGGASNLELLYQLISNMNKQQNERLQAIARQLG